MSIPVAADLIKEVEDQKKSASDKRNEECRKKVGTLIRDNKRLRKCQALFGITDDVKKELEDKGYSLRDCGTEHGVSIADSWEITW